MAGNRKTNISIVSIAVMREQSKKRFKFIDIGVALCMVDMLMFGAVEGFIRAPRHQA